MNDANLHAVFAEVYTTDVLRNLGIPGKARPPELFWLADRDEYVIRVMTWLGNRLVYGQEPLKGRDLSLARGPNNYAAIHAIERAFLRAVQHIYWFIVHQRAGYA